MAKRPGPKKQPESLLERVRRLIELEIDDYEKRIDANQDRDRRTLVMLATEARKYDAHIQGKTTEYTPEGVVAWAQGLEQAERAELIRRLQAIDAPRGSGLG